MESIPVPRPPAELPTEAELMSTWKGDLNKPLVTVVCMTYNHESFIRDALHGFLIQRTTFPFRVVVHDDASTDRTTEIIKDFEVRYPAIIRGVYQTENLYSRGLRARPFVEPLLLGKYIALCEGDDFWTDPSKLQKQVDFLEENPDFVVSGHDAFIVDKKGALISESKLAKRYRRDFLGEDLIHGRCHILTMSMVFRNVELGDVLEQQQIKNGDRFLISRLGWFGSYKYHENIKSAGYRRHSGGIWSGSDDTKRFLMSMSTLIGIASYYNRLDQTTARDSFIRQAQRKVLSTLGTAELIRVIGTRVYRKLRGSMGKA